MSWYAQDVTKVEVRFSGSTWTDVSAYVDLSAGMTIDRGRADETGDAINPGTLSLSLVNDDGRFSPEMSGSPYYPYVVEGVAIRTSMLVDGSWEPRFYGTVQSWSAAVLSVLGNVSRCAVTASGVLGAFPSHTLRHPADEVVRTTSGVVAHWPLRDTEAPITSLIGSAVIAANEPTVGGLGAGAEPLPLEDGSDPHPSLTSGSGGLKLTATGIPTPDATHWRVRFVLFSEPTDDCTLIRLGGASGSLNLGWDATAGFTCALMTGSGLPTSYPIVLELGNPGGSMLYCRWSAADGSVTSASAPTGYTYYAPSQISVNPTLSGGAVWSIGHLHVLSGAPDSSELGAFAAAILGPRVPSSVTAAALLSAWVGGPTVSGGTVGSAALPTLADRDAADALSALVAGMGARLVDDLDGTLTWVDFPPSATAVTLPAEKVSPPLTWETSDIGRYSDATVTRYDGSQYTATSADGNGSSTSVEGVHATWVQDRSYADWLVNSPVKARLAEVSFDMPSLSAADQATLAGVTVADRVTIGSLPSAIMPASMTHIVEGISDSVSSTGWTITLRFSPDVYSRLGIYDTSTWDSGVLWAP